MSYALLDLVTIILFVVEHILRIFGDHPRWWVKQPVGCVAPVLGLNSVLSCLSQLCEEWHELVWCKRRGHMPGVTCTSLCSTLLNVIECNRLLVNSIVDPLHIVVQCYMLSWWFPEQIALLVDAVPGAFVVLRGLRLLVFLKNLTLFKGLRMCSSLVLINWQCDRYVYS